MAANATREFLKRMNARGFEGVRLAGGKGSSTESRMGILMLPLAALCQLRV